MVTHKTITFAYNFHQQINFIMSDNKNRQRNKKTDSLQQHTEDSQGKFLTTNQGVKVNDDQNSLKAGERGPSLLEDFILREKITHFDHERIPERVVHARGSGAHGVFQVYESMAQYTRAGFLQDPSLKTQIGRASCRERIVKWIARG